jgi:hypothetical protein
MKRTRMILTSLALLGGLALGLASVAKPSAAQIYLCPPGTYFLAGSGCYPSMGAPPVYYYPPQSDAPVPTGPSTLNGSVGSFRANPLGPSALSPMGPPLTPDLRQGS